MVWLCVRSQDTVIGRYPDISENRSPTALVLGSGSDSMTHCVTVTILYDVL